MEKTNHITKQPYLPIVEDHYRLPWIILKTAEHSFLSEHFSHDVELCSLPMEFLSFQTPSLGSSGIGWFGSVSLPLYFMSVMNLWKL